MTALCAKAGAAVRKLSREMQTTRMIHLCRSPHNLPYLKRKHGRRRSMPARVAARLPGVRDGQRGSPADQSGDEVAPVDAKFPRRMGGSTLTARRTRSARRLTPVFA